MVYENEFERISDPVSFRWNVVGFQGSLMSYFTEPIYFSSIILGSLYHADHLSRAMYQRIAEIEDLPQPFSLNRPLLSGRRDTVLSQTICHLLRTLSVLMGHFQIYQQGHLQVLRCKKYQKSRVLTCLWLL